jgi:opacity protein-like surface antigen
LILKLGTLVLLATVCLPSFGQKYEIGPYASYARTAHADLGSVRLLDPADSDTNIGDTKFTGVRFTVNTRGYYGHELHYARGTMPLNAIVNEFFTGEVQYRSEKLRVSDLGYNFLLYMMPNREKWRPYLTFGAATLNYRAPRFYEWTSASTRTYNVNYGAGIKLLPTKRFMVRIDFRHARSGKPFSITGASGGAVGGSLSFMELSAGVSFGIK